MKDQNTKIAIPTAGSLEIVLIKDIIRCEGLQNYTRIFLANGKKLISSDNLGKYCLALKDFNFYPCHKSHIINQNYIIRYNKSGNVEMQDQTIVPIARRRKKDFVRAVLSNETLLKTTMHARLRQDINLDNNDQMQQIAG